MHKALVLILMVVFTAAVFAGDRIIKNPGFEDEFSGNGIASEWSDQSSWAPVKVTYSEDRNTRVQNR